MHDLSKGKILVTGGAGFIGSALIWALNKRKLYNIVVTDILGEDERFRNLIPLKFEDYLEAADLLNRLENQQLADIKTIFHLGASSSTTESDCTHLIHNNYEFTKDLAKWAQNNDARFVYASSAATYGDGSTGMSDYMEDLNSLRPLNMYGYSKHLFDLYAQKHGYLNNIIGLKYFNVYGPNEGHKANMRSVVHKAYHQIKKEGKVNLFKSYRAEYKDGEQMRDFLYVKDAVDMTIHLAESDQLNGLYNLGSGEASTWLSLVSTIFEALGQEENINFIEMPESIRKNYQYYTKADISKLRETGYNQEITPLNLAVKDYVQNYLETGNYLSAKSTFEVSIN